MTSRPSRRSDHREVFEIVLAQLSPALCDGFDGERDTYLDALVAHISTAHADRGIKPLIDKAGEAQS